MHKIVLLFLFTLGVAAQNYTLTGVVSDTLNQPLENANVIARPQQKEAQMRFAIADHLGRYKIDLDAKVSYELRVSYIGYKDAVYNAPINNTDSEHTFILKQNEEQLNEIIINYDYQPVIVKKDTLIYLADAFASGNERKLKELLNKMPNVEVDKKGNVLVQGKKVTTLMVDYQTFFGGGTKLAVENIPADAIEKVEVIDHFNKVGFLKEVSDSDELAMNIVLKKDKKNFVFGDIDVAKGENPFYKAHAALFYYSPKSKVNTILDANTIGKSVFSFQDLMRFSGGASVFLTNNNRPSFTNLWQFADDNTQVATNKNEFAAFNIGQYLTDKTQVDVYGIFAKTRNTSLYNAQRTFIQNTGNSTEVKNQTSANRDLLGIGNIKLEHTPNKLEKWYYNAQYQATDNVANSNLNSIQNTQLFQFLNQNDEQNQSFKQYIEWHKKYNKTHTTTFVVQHNYDVSNPNVLWQTNQPFLTDFIPLQNDAFYRISKIKKTKSNVIDAFLKHYWVLNNYNHIYTYLGNNYQLNHWQTEEFQTLSNGSLNNFNTSGFGNQLRYGLQDAYFGVEYKFKIGKLISKPALYMHRYSISLRQDENAQYNKNYLEPKLTTTYEFNSAEDIEFNYNRTNNFPSAAAFSNRYTLLNYNSVFKGNSMLANERFDNFNLKYKKNSSYRGLMLFANSRFTHKSRTNQSISELEGVNQYQTQISTQNPETSFSTMVSLTKKIKRFRFSVDVNTRNSSFFQFLNNEQRKVKNENQNAGFKVSTASKSLPDISIKYSKGFNKQTGFSKSGFTTDKVTVDTDIDFLKHFVFASEYEYQRNSSNGNINQFHILNSNLSYQKENKPWRYELIVQNLFNNQFIQNNTLSAFVISNDQTAILPRVILLGLSYKL